VVLHKEVEPGIGDGDSTLVGVDGAGGKFSAAAMDVLVRTLKKVDLPTLGRPTMPIFKLVPSRPRRTTFSSSTFFLGGILKSG